MPPGEPPAWLRPAIVLLLAGLAVAGLLLLARAPQTRAQTAAGTADRSAEAASPAATAMLNCRIGLTAWNPALSQARPWEWGAGWYLTFGARGEPPGAMEYLRMVRTYQDKYWDGSGWVYSDTVTFRPALTDGPGGLGPLLQAYPGSWWVVGNEPDRGPNEEWSWWPGQDGCYPEVYAQAYYSVYTFIRERDSSARIGPGGLVEVTPGRLQYLDLVWETYRERYGTSMPTDFWTMHIYILPEAWPDGSRPNGSANIALGTDLALAYRESGGNPDLCHNPAGNVYCWADHDDLVLFDQQVRRMREWMRDHGLERRALWLDEYSILHPFEDYDDPVDPTHCYLQDEFGRCFTAARVSNWLTRTLDYLTTATDTEIGDPLDHHRLVQRVAWFSLYTPRVGYVSNLVSGTTSFSPTMVGLTYQDYLANYALQANLLAAQAPSSSFCGSSVPVMATIGVVVVNNGDTALPLPVTVTWYMDPELTQPIASQVLTSLPGCHSTAELHDSWVIGEPGLHFYWAYVDSDNRLAEADEGDNVARGVVLVQAHCQNLPLLAKRAPGRR